MARFRKQNLVPFRITGLHDQVVLDSVTNAYGAVYEILNSKGLSTEVLDENEIIVCIDDEGGVSGPSCGLAVSVAIYSLAVSQAPKKRFGITGKISPDGRVCAIGGVEAKYSACEVNNLPIMMPSQNEEIAPSETCVKVSHLQEAIALIFD